MKKFFFGLFLFLFLGCMKSSWIAKFYMVKAENAVEKAHEMRIKKELSKERQRYYRDACKDFTLAYRYDPEIFTLNRLYMAADACLRIGQSQQARRFQEIEEEYTRLHPKEAEYGDAGFMIGLE